MRLDGRAKDFGRAFLRVPAPLVDAGGRVSGDLSFLKPGGIVDGITTLNLGSFGVSMNSNLTQLDRLLYGWLAESDDRRFEAAFRRYYAAASSQVVRYLARRSSLPDLDCEQIAVDALLKFFGRAGRDRRQAADLIGDALPRVQPLDLGAFHVRQVHRWTSDVGAFRQTSMSFLAHEDDAGEAWKSEILALTGRIAPLQRQAWQLLEAARSAAADVAAQVDAGFSCEEDSSDDDVAASPEYLVVRRFALGLREAARTGTLAPMAVGSRYPKLLDFVDRSWSVADALPLLRVPTNGYLFDIAQSLYLDECKARGRLKRGGSGFAAHGANEEGHLQGTPTSQHPLLSDDTGWPEEDGAPVAWQSSAVDIGTDPIEDQIEEDFCERFFTYLRKPLKDAEEAYRNASARGRAELERKRLESIAKKNDRLMAVLTMRIEGRTQEDIAETLDISRNQVKYIVEQVQASYDQFRAADSGVGAR